MAHQLGRGGSGELLKLSLWFFSHLIESHVLFNPGTEPTLSDDNRLFIRDEVRRLKAPVLESDAEPGCEKFVKLGAWENAHFATRSKSLQKSINFIILANLWNF